MKIYDNTYYYFADEDLKDAAARMPRGKIISSAEAQEKFLKAYIEYTVKEPSYEVMHSHSIALILRNVRTLTDSFNSIYPDMLDLGNCYFNLRYPSNGFFKPTEELAEQSYNIACRVREIVDNELSKLEETEEAEEAEENQF